PGKEGSMEFALLCFACLLAKRLKSQVSSNDREIVSSIISLLQKRVDDPTHQHTDLPSSQLCGSQRIARVSNLSGSSSQWTHDRHASESKRVIEPVSIWSISCSFCNRVCHN